MRVVDKRDGGLISLSLFLLAMLILSTKYYRAAISVEKNHHVPFFYGGDGHIDGYEYFELDVLTDSYIGRVLGDENGKSPTETSKHRQKTCGPGNEPYRKCLAEAKKKPPQNCNTYNRECKPKSNKSG